MTQQIRPVTATEHGSKAWKPVSHHGFAADSAVVSICGDEVGQAACNFALAFAGGEKPALVAVLGLAPGQNLYVAPDGTWAGRYTPAVFRGYPFKLARGENDQLTLCFDEASGLLAERGEGEAFFDDKGAPTPAVRKIFEFLVQVSRSTDIVTSGSALLMQHGLLEPWPLTLRDGERERQIGGLQRVNEAKLNALADDAFLELRRQGALAIAYAQLLSMPNISALGRLAHAHGVHAQRSEKMQKEAALLVEPPGDGDLSIDWNALFNKGE